MSVLLNSVLVIRRGMFVLVAAIAVAGLVAMPGCGDRDVVREPVIEYTTRAIITQLPTIHEPDLLYARHEAIPEFRNTSGRYGMNVMVMPFPLPPSGVSIDGLTVGDQVVIRFAVTYSADFSSLKGYVARSIERLPEGTVLDFTPLEQIEGFDPETGTVGGSDRPDAGE